MPGPYRFPGKTKYLPVRIKQKILVIKITGILYMHMLIFSYFTAMPYSSSRCAFTCSLSRYSS